MNTWQTATLLASIFYFARFTLRLLALLFTLTWRIARWIDRQGLRIPWDEERGWNRERFMAHWRVRR